MPPRNAPVVEVETPPPIAEIIVPLSDRGELNFFYPCREALRETETKLIAAAEEINRTGSGADLVITITKL